MSYEPYHTEVFMFEPPPSAMHKYIYRLFVVGEGEDPSITANNLARDGWRLAFVWVENGTTNMMFEFEI